MITANMKRPTVAELAERSQQFGKHPVKGRLFSQNFELNMIAVLLIAGTCIALTAYMTGTFDEQREEQAVNQWVVRNQAGDKARQAGNLDLAQKEYKLAIAEASQFGKNDPRMAKSLVSLGGCYIEDKEYGKAEIQLKRATSILEKSYGKDCPESTTAMMLLARSYTEQGKKKEGAALRQKALAILEGTAGASLTKKKGK
jgi:uncharacterized protein HemY